MSELLAFVLEHEKFRKCVPHPPFNPFNPHKLTKLILLQGTLAIPLLGLPLPQNHQPERLRRERIRVESGAS
jgi:hypothetical protein